MNSANKGDAVRVPFASRRTTSSAIAFLSGAPSPAPSVAEQAEHSQATQSKSGWLGYDSFCNGAAVLTKTVHGIIGECVVGQTDLIVHIEEAAVKIGRVDGKRQREEHIDSFGRAAVSIAQDVVAIQLKGLVKGIAQRKILTVKTQVVQRQSPVARIEKVAG